MIVSGRHFRASCVSSRLSLKRNSRFATNTRAQRFARVGTPLVGRERTESAVDDGAVSCEVRGSWSSSTDGPPNVCALFVRFAITLPLESPPARLDIF